MCALAFQIPEEVFQRLKRHLERESERTGKKVNQKEFMLNLIRQTLDEAERVLMRALKEHSVWCLEAMASIGSPETEPKQQCNTDSHS